MKATKLKIIDAAAKLFSQKGYETTGVEDIMAIAKVSKGGLYHYFQSKEQMLDLVIEKLIEPFAYQIFPQIKPADYQQPANVDEKAFLKLLSLEQNASIQVKLLGALRDRLVPALETAFFGKVADLVERQARAHLLFSITTSTLTLQENLRKDAKFTQVYNQQMSKAVRALMA
jgi:AcrR family transcriptional regulator